MVLCSSSHFPNREVEVPQIVARVGFFLPGLVFHPTSLPMVKGFFADVPLFLHFSADVPLFTHFSADVPLSSGTSATFCLVHVGVYSQLEIQTRWITRGLITWTTRVL